MKASFNRAVSLILYIYTLCFSSLIPAPQPQLWVLRQFLSPAWEEKCSHHLERVTACGIVNSRSGCLPFLCAYRTVHMLVQTAYSAHHNRRRWRQGWSVEGLEEGSWYTWAMREHYLFTPSLTQPIVLHRDILLSIFPLSSLFEFCP